MNRYPSSVFDMPGLLSQELQCSCEQAHLLLTGLSQMLVQEVDPMLRRIQQGLAKSTCNTPLCPSPLRHCSNWHAVGFLTCRRETGCAC